MAAFLDVPTLLATASLADFCIFLGLGVIWRAAREETFVLAWCLGHGLATVAMLLVSLRGPLPALALIQAPGGILLACFGCLWLGYRRFSGRSGRYDPLFAGAGFLVWFVLAQIGDAFDDMNVRLSASSAIEMVYLVAIVRDLLRHYRATPMPAVGLTIVLVAVHLIKQAGVIAHAFTGTIEPSALVIPSTWAMALSLLESAAFSVLLGLAQLVLIGQRSEQRFRIAAETDALTGLANRRSFFERLQPRLEATGDHGALIVFDIDHFKRVNDTYGHPAGDVALAEFAGALSAAAPAGSIPARIGGEEFALFLPDAATEAAAEAAERIRRRIGELRITTDGGAFRLTVSCGVAGVAETGPDPHALHGAADAALYAAKSGGRNRVAVHAPQTSSRRDAAPRCESGGV
jgi:diguanylate cyclase (GGDEF)-like protein